MGFKDYLLMLVLMGSQRHILTAEVSTVMTDHVTRKPNNIQAIGKDLRGKPYSLNGDDDTNITQTQYPTLTVLTKPPLESRTKGTGNQGFVMPSSMQGTDNSQPWNNNQIQSIKKPQRRNIEHPERRLSDEEKLMDYLLRYYNPSARPVLKGSDTVNIQMQFSLMHIKDLDIKSQILTTTGLLILEWNDERLTWRPEEHNNLHEIIIEIEKLWKPEFAVINGAEEIYSEYNQFRAVITSNGTIHWEPGGVFKTMCEIDITYYPFDDQKCKLTFGAWTYHTGKMNMSNLAEKVNNDSYNKNGEWTITETQVKRDEFTYANQPNEPFAYVDFVIFLRRRHTFYILNVILPSIMTSVLLLSVFFCTPAQKVQIGVVVLLSFRIFLLNVADNIPKTSDHIPLLGIYLTCTMAITTLSMVLTVLVLNLHHISERPVPGWARSCLFIGIARLMGMCNTADILAQKHKKKKEKDFRQTFMNNIYRRPSNSPLRDCIEEKASMMNEMQTPSRLQTDSAALDNNHDATGTDVGGSPSIFPTGRNGDNIGDMQKEQFYAKKQQLCVEEEKIKEQSRTEDNAKDWKKVAEIFDRLFFWLFLFAIVITTLILFHPLTKEDRFNSKLTN